MTAEQAKQLDDISKRLRKVEDEMIRNDSVSKLIEKLDERLIVLEKHDEEFMVMVQQAIKVSTDHANNNHKQTWTVLFFLFSLFIGAVIYFNTQNQERAMEIQRNSTNIDVITKSLDKIDAKLDTIRYKIQEDKK
jgi:hypothetical protein